MTPFLAIAVFIWILISKGTDSALFFFSGIFMGFAVEAWARKQKARQAEEAREGDT